MKEGWGESLPLPKPRTRLKAGVPHRDLPWASAVCRTQSDGERGTWGEEKVLPVEMVRKPALSGEFGESYNSGTGGGRERGPRWECLTHGGADGFRS